MPFYSIFSTAVEIVSFFWLVVLLKKLCFWVWLWQLKEYHFKRFLSHFETYKGKKLILNFFNFSKLISLFGLILAFPFFLPILLSIYFFDFFSTALHILKKTFRYPVLTKKTVLILGTGFLLIVSVFLSLKNFPSEKFILFLLIFDLFSPIIFSILVFCFWPLSFFWQKQLIKKAIEKREKFKDLLVIGITGSYGKTSTKEFLSQILSAKFNVLKTRAHQNSEVGISQCILQDLKPEHQIFVCEMGAYNKGGIKLLCNIAKPKIGILTGINEQHLFTFGSQENIIKTKFELIESLPKEGLAILNESDQNIKNEKLKIKNYNPKLRKIKYCSIEQARDLKVKKELLSFNFEGIDFNINLAGQQNVINLLMAICCAKELGMTLEEISRACQKIKPFPRTMEPKKGIGGVTIIDDSYSANPQGVFAALDYLGIYEGKKIIIMPCLIELGRASKRIHKEIGQKIGKICDLAIITTKDKFQEIKEGAIKSGMKEKNILFLEKPREIFEKIKLDLKPENVILLESRVPKGLREQLTTKN